MRKSLVLKTRTSLWLISRPFARRIFECCCGVIAGSKQCFVGLRSCVVASKCPRVSHHLLKNESPRSLNLFHNLLLYGDWPISKGALQKKDEKNRKIWFQFFHSFHSFHSWHWARVGDGPPAWNGHQSARGENCKNEKSEINEKNKKDEKNSQVKKKESKTKADKEIKTSDSKKTSAKTKKSSKATSDKVLPWEDIVPPK